MVNKQKIINDPVHGFIRLPFAIIYDIIEHPYFQRLRRIGQTGLLNVIFPGATHTRFAHALGAMHLMHTAIETLRWKGTTISEEEEIAALAAILLHDVGHGPFSHALEQQVMPGWHHERLSLELMQKINEDLGYQLDLALQMFQGLYPRKFFNQLISSQLDMDRMDYLKRDSFYTGVAEGNVNAQRLISMLNVADDELVVDAKGIFSIEHFLTARMFMYWQVYYHKTATVGEDLLIKILDRAKNLIMKGEALTASENLTYFLAKTKSEDISEKDIQKFTELDDNDILQAIKYWQNSDDFVLSYLCEAVIQRKFPKTILSSNIFPEDLILKKIEQTNQLFNINNGEELVYSISRRLLPYNSQKQPIKLLQKNGEKINLDQSENQILSSSITQKTTKYILAFPREL